MKARHTQSRKADSRAFKSIHKKTGCAVSFLEDYEKAKEWVLPVSRYRKRARERDSQAPFYTPLISVMAADIFMLFFCAPAEKSASKSSSLSDLSVSFSRIRGIPFLFPFDLISMPETS